MMKPAISTKNVTDNRMKLKNKALNDVLRKRAVIFIPADSGRVVYLLNTINWIQRTLIFRNT